MKIKVTTNMFLSNRLIKTRQPKKIRKIKMRKMSKKNFMLMNLYKNKSMKIKKRKKQIQVWSQQLNKS